MKNEHSDTLRVDGSQIGVFKERDKVGFGSFLQSHDCRRLEAEIGLMDGLVRRDIRRHWKDQNIP